MNPIVLVVTHKPEVMLSTSIATPINVNHKIDVPPHWLSDNKGDNIAEKNANYCELTAMYWAWKNLPKEYTHVGLFHYRRALVTNNCLKNRLRHSIKITDKSFASELYSDDELLQMLGSYDVILPKQAKLSMSLEKHYKCRHIPEDWDLLVEVLMEMYPDKANSIRGYFLKENKISWANMFVMKREVFEEYSDWLFNILFALEKKIYISEYPYQARVFGFLSERLLNLFFYNLNSFRVKQLPYLDLI